MVPLACLFNTMLSLGGIWQYASLIIALILLLIASSFFSCTETAFSTVNIIRLKNYVEEKKKGAKKALYLAEKFDKTLITLLVGNNLVNIAATTIGAYIIVNTITNPTLANIVNTFAMTIVILIFGEILPKSYAKENAEKTALKCAGLLYFISKILWPFSFLFYKLRAVFMKQNRADITPQVTEEELETIIETMEDEGVIENEDAELMQNALDINDTNVVEIMTPRVDVVALDVNDSIEKIKNVFFEYQYSRLPVYDKDKDNMIGILSERDFFTAYIKSKGTNINIRNIITSPYFVAKTTKVDDLIREMQKLKKHFAIVLDEYGGTSGIVTMEDALEELVGEIYDEYDDDEADDYTYDLINNNKYKVNPEMSLEDLFESLELGPTPESNYNDVGGFVYELCEEPPYKGKEVYFHTVYEEDSLDDPIHNEYNLHFVIDKVTKRRISSLILEIQKVEKDNKD